MTQSRAKTTTFPQTLVYRHHDYVRHDVRHRHRLWRVLDGCIDKTIAFKLFLVIADMVAIALFKRLVEAIF